MENKYAHLRLLVLETEFKYVSFASQTDFSEAIKYLNEDHVDMCSIFRTPSEMSAILPANVPIKAVKEEAGWYAFSIVGDMPFGTVQGLIATISSSLRDIGLGVCVVSTFKTDFFMVRKGKIDEAKQKLEADGWVFIS